MNLGALVKSAAVDGGAQSVNSCVVVQGGNSGHMRPPVRAKSGDEALRSLLTHTGEQKFRPLFISLLRLVPKLVVVASQEVENFSNRSRSGV